MQLRKFFDIQQGGCGLNLYHRLRQNTRAKKTHISSQPLKLVKEDIIYILDSLIVKHQFS